MEAAAGHNLDMLDADRLRQWADNIATYGPDLSNWASTGFVSDWLRQMADRVEQAVRDEGALLAERDRLREALEQSQQTLEFVKPMGPAGPFQAAIDRLIKSNRAVLASCTER